MALTANASRASKELAPTGTHVARCVQVIDLGRQQDSRDPEKWTHKILVGWELPNCKYVSKWTDDDGEHEEERTHMIWNRYTLSLFDQSWLYKDLQAWRGEPWTDAAIKSWEAKKLLDVPCMIGVIHKDGWANKSSVSQVPHGMEIPERANELLYFELGEEADMSVFEKLGPKLQDTIKASKEWQEAEGAYDQEEVDKAADAKPVDEDIPF